eukprot:TRINITY_DN4169_c0_g1_i1.p1 TRINITY_DN4169_c0_g1~~TRINITY_DN4169_c0_g1_i1.p1  ORF type:complete len:345 (-),score=95.15 TRINITY_DN4169_c0_g1_i1:50-1084(-)
MTTNKQVCLIERPKEHIQESHFKIEEIPTPSSSSLSDGGILLRTLYLSVDPYMRPKMSMAKSYTAMYDLDKPLFGDGSAQVVASKNPDFKEGDIVSSNALRWKVFEIYTKEEVEKMPIRKINPRGLPSIESLHLLGMTGATAYFGLLELGKPKKGDVVLVSGAAGAVGSIVGQIAKIHGCRTIGVVGSAEKAKMIKEEFGFDEAINYKTDNISEKLKEVAPNGINIYFDNVGGSTLDAALENMATYGRVLSCGSIGSYNKAEPVYNYFRVVTAKLQILGFIVYDYIEKWPQAHDDLAKWAKEGKIKTLKSIDNGIDHMVHSLKGLFEGKNTGKLLVKISDETTH